MNRIIIYAPMSTGSHWLARSLCRNLKIPYTYNWFNEWPSIDLIGVWHKSWDQEEINKLDAKAISLTRNPLDHLASYMSLFNISHDNYKEAEASQEFITQRKICKSSPEENLISYEDMINNKENCELKIKSILQIENFNLESVEETRMHIPEYVRKATSGYWRDIFSTEEAINILNILQEEYEI